MGIIVVCGLNPDPTSCVGGQLVIGGGMGGRVGGGLKTAACVTCLRDIIPSLATSLGIGGASSPRTEW